MIQIVFRLDGGMPVDRKDARLLEIKRALIQHGYMAQVNPQRCQFENGSVILVLWLDQRLKVEDEVWFRLRFNVLRIFDLEG